ncbi:hypothetical protein Q9L58_003267 [Maublancomyces gigas]|uniref:Uncharacterized protein n=1 Tax=Discina gigas TaxID=1032678 RepID=A0ABR3GPP8_9PEZI
MSYRLLVPSATAIGLASYSLGTKRPLLFTPIRCETTSPWSNFSSWGLRSKPEPYTTVQTQAHATQKTTFSPLLYRQISTGSFLGLAAGFAVGKFSKSIGLVVGSLLLLIEFLASRGVHIIPYQWLQRFTNKIDVRGLVTKNMAFKASFGATFAIAAIYN